MSCIIPQLYPDVSVIYCREVVGSTVCLEACVSSRCNISEQVLQHPNGVTI